MIEFDLTIQKYVHENVLDTKMQKQELNEGKEFGKDMVLKGMKKRKQ